MTRLLPALLLAALVAVAPAAQPAERAPVKRAVNPSSMAATTTNGYSQLNVAPSSGTTVYVSGQTGLVAGADNAFERQVDRSFENLRMALEAGGATPADVVRITLLIVDHDPAKLAYLGMKRAAFFGTEAPPSSTLIPVSRLYANDVAFEIDATAVVAGR